MSEPMHEPPALRQILGFRLTSHDPKALARFYERGLGFTAGDAHFIAKEEMASLGLSGQGERIPLRLGGQVLELDAFASLGRPYPQGVDAADLSFQHFALTTVDAAASLARALQAGASLISDGGPVKLPASSGGVIAVKFRDPEGHPLEFLQFAIPPKSPLAIDHSAISVSDVVASLDFYRARGLQLGDRTLNQGPTQAALDGLDQPVVDVLPLLPNHPAPHLELLGYRTARGRVKGARSASDVAATRIVWASDQSGLMVDPDGHLHQLTLAGSPI